MENKLRVKGFTLCLFFSIFFFSKAQTPTFSWANSIGSLGLDQAFSCTVDASGNIYTTGIFSSTVDFDPGPGVFNLTAAGGVDAFVAKYSSSGTFVWAKSLGGSSGNGEYGKSIAIDASGNVYSTGYFDGPTDFDPGPGTFTLNSSGATDIYISKLDNSGNFVWAKNLGGSSSDVSYSIKTDPSGNVYTIGTFSLSADFDPGPGSFSLTSNGFLDFFISKLDALGNFVWAKGIGGSIGNDEGFALTIDASGNSFATGYYAGTVDFDPGPSIFNMTSTNGDLFVLKLNSAGNFVFSKDIGGSAIAIGLDITLDVSGNIYTTGEFQGTIDFDPSASSFTLSANGNYDVLISKLDAIGNFVWAKSFGGTFLEKGNSIRTDVLGNVYTGGFYNLSCDFDPGPGTFSLTSTGGADAFISKLDAFGNFIWAESFGGTTGDFINCISLNGLGYIYSVGHYNGTSDFDPGPGTYFLTYQGGGHDAFIHKMLSVAATLNFDGNDDRVDLGTSITNSLSTINKITVEAWVNPAVLTGTGTIIGNYNTNVANQMQFLLRRNGTGYQFCIGNAIGGNSVVVNAPLSATANVWQHISGTWDGSVSKIYINGNLSATSAATYTTFGNFSNPVWIGSENFNSEKFNGNIDEVRIWSRALCQSEIQNNMNGEIPTNANGLMANYHFNQGVESSPNPTVTTLVDATINAITGTLTNIALTGTSSNWIAPGGVYSGSLINTFVGPTISVMAPDSLCSGTSTVISANGNVISYTWTSGPTTQTNNISPSITTTYSVSGTNSLGCISNITVKTISVIPSPSITASSNMSLICVGQTSTLTASGANTLTWNPGSINGASIAITPSATTNYTITGTNTNGCMGSTVVTQYVSNCNILNEINNSSFVNIYPNPASSFVALDFSFVPENTSLKIFNALGQLVKSENITGTILQLNIDTLKEGVYLLKIFQGVNTIHSSKLLKQ